MAHFYLLGAVIVKRRRRRSVVYIAPFRSSWSLYIVQYIYKPTHILQTQKDTYSHIIQNAC